MILNRNSWNDNQSTHSKQYLNKVNSNKKLILKLEENLFDAQIVQSILGKQFNTINYK